MTRMGSSVTYLTGRVGNGYSVAKLILSVSQPFLCGTGSATDRRSKPSLSLRLNLVG